VQVTPVVQQNVNFQGATFNNNSLYQGTPYASDNNENNEAFPQEISKILTTLMVNIPLSYNVTGFCTNPLQLKRISRHLTANQDLIFNKK